MGGCRWRAVSDPELAAAAPKVGARHRRGLKWNREADVKGERGGRAGSHVWVWLGAGSQPGGAVESPRQRAQPDDPQADLSTCARTSKGQPRARLPPASKALAGASSWHQGDPQFPLALNM